VIAQKVLHYSSRGMDVLYKHLPHDIYEQAAQVILDLPRDRNVLLFTGFQAGGYQETDGPVGTYFLAKTLFKLGFYPIIITDFHCKDYFDQADQNFETLVVPRKGFAQSFMYGKIIETYDPVAMIAVERPGRSKDGHYRNMKGEIIDGQNAPNDQFFLENLDNILTIGIGDGGNEIGMGNYQELLINELFYQHPSCIKTDYCLFGTTSNWACYGLIYLLAKDSLPNITIITAYYDYILSLGAVDGITGESKQTVDSHEMSETIYILNLIES